jgi:hypothetical protein
VIARGTGPPDEDRAPHGQAGRGARVEQLAGGYDVLTIPQPADEDMRPRCDAAGIYCGALTVEQLQAFGRAKACCRSYYDTDEVA